MKAKFAEYVNTKEIRKAKRVKGLTNLDMCNLLNFKSKVTYYYLETGQTEPKITQMLAISQILGVPVAKIFNLKPQ